MVQAQTPQLSDAPARPYDPQAVEVTPSGISAGELYRRKRMRNLMLALALGGFVALIFAVTVVKLSVNAAG